MTTAAKLTPAQIGQNFREGYAAVAPTLANWEKAKAVLLVTVGQECLALVRQTLEPLPDHDLVARKTSRAALIKQIEAALPAETDGIGAPQVNRWIRWAGACALLGPQVSEVVSLGLRQSHLMVLEKVIEQNEARAEFRLKGPWQSRLAEIQSALRSAVDSSSTASELEAVLDQLAVLAPSAAVPARAVLAPPAPALTTTTPTAPEPKPTGAPPARRETVTSPKAAPVTPVATSAAKPAMASTSPAPLPEAPRPVPATAPPCPADLADQAFLLLQQPEILAGVFRRGWKPELLKQIVENLIRANGEQVDNAHGLAVAYHRLKPFVLTFFEEYAAEGRFKLRRKDEPEPPTLEQLAPAAELAPA
jgi:hypothetical protein